MIYTLTLNPAIDMNIISDKLLPNQVNRTKHVEYSPNGKGVNVSIVLKHYKMESTIIGVFGGFSGNYIVEELKNRDYSVLPIWVNEDTRINVFANDGHNEFKFVSPGSFVSEEKQKEILDLIKSLKDMKYLVISGSLPPGINENFFNEIVFEAKKLNAEIIFDISSLALKHLVTTKPFLIKPNDDELKEIFNLDSTTKAEVIHSIKTLHKQGVKNILLTMGSKGLYFSNGEDIYFCNTPKINLLSSACAGDSCLAAFLSSWLDGKDIEFSLKLASATGANVAESNGIGDLKKVKEYMEKINIEKVEVIYE